MSDWWSGAGDMKLVDCDDDDDDTDMNDEAAERRYKVVFHLYGSTQSDIDKVIGEIDELGKEAVSDRVLDTADNQAHIAKLTPDQVLHALLNYTNLYNYFLSAQRLSNKFGCIILSLTIRYDDEDLTCT